MMNAVCSKPLTKKRKVDQVERGLHKLATSGTHERSNLVQASESVCFDRDQKLHPQQPAGLNTAIPLESLKQSDAETENHTNTAQIAIAESYSDGEPVLKAFYTGADSGGSQAQLGRLNGFCTYEEALAIRYHAREIGLDQFFQDSVVQHRIPLQALCTAFGIPPPAVPAGSPDSTLRNRLRKAIAVDMSNRIKLHKYNSVDDAIALLRNAKRIMVITGAGISTSLNIPDFRSSGGLYPRLREMGFEEPESVFSRDTFEQDPHPFFSVASMILPPTDGRFTPAHAFLRLLQDKGKLLTLYTQNIDGIDLTAGIRRDNLVQLHGSFETATCTRCEHRVNGDEIFPKIRNGEVPECAECARERQFRIDQMATMRAQNGRSVRRRTQRSSVEPTTEPAGIMRPDIVFMGEPPKPHVKRFQRDCAQVDLLIVLGTSLPVEPVNTMPNRIPPNVPQIYIGRQEMYRGTSIRIDFDIQLLGECDVIVELLANGCAWDLKHEMLPTDTVIEVDLSCGRRHCHDIRRVVKAAICKDDEIKSEI